jgi:hypothetical protein
LHEAKIPAVSVLFPLTFARPTKIKEWIKPCTLFKNDFLRNFGPVIYTSAFLILTNESLTIRPPQVD